MPVRAVVWEPNGKRSEGRREPDWYLWPSRRSNQKGRLTFICLPKTFFRRLTGWSSESLQGGLHICGNEPISGDVEGCLYERSLPAPQRHFFSSPLGALLCPDLASRRHKGSGYIMKLPRRTPWANVGELDEVCRLIYSETSTLESRRKAANRVGDDTSHSLLSKNAHLYHRCKPVASS